MNFSDLLNENNQLAVPILDALTILDVKADLLLQVGWQTLIQLYSLHSHFFPWYANSAGPNICGANPSICCCRWSTCDCEISLAVIRIFRGSWGWLSNCWMWNPFAWHVGCSLLFPLGCDRIERESGLAVLSKACQTQIIEQQILLEEHTWHRSPHCGCHQNSCSLPEDSLRGMAQGKCTLPPFDPFPWTDRSFPHFDGSPLISMEASVLCSCWTCWCCAFYILLDGRNQWRALCGTRFDLVLLLYSFSRKWCRCTLRWVHLMEYLYASPLCPI